MEALQGRCYNLGGCVVEVIRMGSKHQRPAQINRRRAALAPVYHKLKQLLDPTEALEHTHLDRSVLRIRRDFRELAAIEWADEGEKATVKPACNFDKSVPKVVKGRIMTLGCERRAADSGALEVAQLARLLGGAYSFCSRGRGVTDAPSGGRDPGPALFVPPEWSDLLCPCVARGNSA